LYVNKLNKKKFKAPKEQKFVKFIDKIDYLWFLGLYIFGILFFAYLYHSYEPDSVVIPTFNVDENHNNTFKDLLYFSIVTISTLGYGDYPQLVLEDYLQVWKLSMD